jgi:hypothetical protein
MTWPCVACLASRPGLIAQQRVFLDRYRQVVEPAVAANSPAATPSVRVSGGRSSPSWTGTTAATSGSPPCRPCRKKTSRPWHENWSPAATANATRRFRRDVCVSPHVQAFLCWLPGHQEVQCEVMVRTAFPDRLLIQPWSPFTLLVGNPLR